MASNPVLTLYGCRLYMSKTPMSKTPMSKTLYCVDAIAHLVLRCGLVENFLQVVVGHSILQIEIFGKLA